MSIAGRRSSLGDEYQLRVALHWLIRLLEDDTIESIQVDSTGLPGEDSSVTVDDIVVLYKNGHACFIQAKKNQTDHKAWSFSDKVLKNELCKARDQLESRANSKVEFYSRSLFGDLASLVENCRYFPDYSAFHREADKNQQESLATLAKILERSENETYSIVTKISFGSPQEFDEWDRQNKSNLARIVPMANLAMPILERYLVSHETNLRDTKYTITRSDVLAKLTEAGISPTPKRTEAEIIAAFKQASSIGRNWLRTIDGKAIPRSELTKIIELIEQGSRTILLTDRPGSGKTCLLLDLVDYIEQEKASVWGLLFIKGDQFTNAESERDLVANGLPEDIVGQCARLAELRRTVVIIDSLDVLSLSRQHEALKVFLRIIDRLEKIDGVTIITVCRNFDLEYDPLLRGRSWQHRVNLQPLDFENEVKPFLINWKVDISNITPELRALLQIPQNLRIYQKLAKLGIPLQPASAYELYNSFLEEVVVKKQTLGTEAIVALQNMAEQLMQQRTKLCSKVVFGTSEDIIQQLKSQEVLLENSSSSLEFSHQTLRECITVRAALAKNQTLAQFILAHPQLPFIRPAVRAFFFYLRASQPDVFRRQVWEVLSHNQIAYHVKRLICESFSEISPVDEDWRSLRRIFQNFPDLFRRLLWRVNNRAWFDILTKYWLGEAQLSPERETWLVEFIQHLSVWMNIYPVEVVALWREAIAQQWTNTQKVAEIISYALNNFQAWNTDGIRELLEALIENVNVEHHLVGKSLSQWVQATNSGDDLLWRYITKNVFLSEDVRLGILADKLRCMPHDFHQNDFLEVRLCQSDTLLTLVLDELETWKAVSARYRLHSNFLRCTSWRIRHSRSDRRLCHDLNVLLDAVEKALKYRVRQNNTWWLQNESRLRKSQELAIRYFVIEAYKENLCDSYSICGVESLLQDDQLFRHSKLSYELGELMHMAYPKISESAQDANQTMILLLLSETRKYEEEYSFEVYRELFDLCLSIPCIFRSENIQEFIDNAKNYFGYTRSEPNIHSWCGWVMPPLSPKDLLKLSDRGIFKLLHYYQAHQNPDPFFGTNMVGGLSEVKRVLCNACSLHPERFVRLFMQFIEENIHKDYLCNVVEGVAFHLRYRFGNLSSAQQWEPIEPPPAGERLAATLLNWLERYWIIWKDGRTVSTALEACCEVLIDSASAERLSLLLFWLYTKYSSDREIRSNSQDIASTAFNSIHGVAAQSAITLCNRLLEKEQPVPELLLLLLRQVAGDTAIYVRVPVLERLPFLTYKKPDLGWQLLADVFKEPQPCLWKYTEQCLYYQYRNNFDLVAPYLNRLLHEGMEESGDIWGRISTLASLAGHISQEALFEALEKNQSHAAWQGATQVFTANLHLQEHTAKCISGILAVLRYENLSNDIIRKVDECFKQQNKINFIHSELALAFIESLPASTSEFDFDGFIEWLGYESCRNPLSALELTEALAEKLETTINASQLWQTKPLISALNEILREADETETDDPQLIQRAINLQDRFLRLGVHGMEELLNRAGQE
jgi:ATPase family associated with various cellular activities (AAA)